ncbi:MAG: HalOD1 output domain-containing protein [Halanaeroarchaeum sp.]
MAQSDCLPSPAEQSTVSESAEETTVHYDSAERTPVHAIVDALCIIRDEPYEELPPLHEFVDTDSLVRLLGSSDDARVIFDYLGHTISVRTDSVTVRPQV